MSGHSLIWSCALKIPNDSRSPDKLLAFIQKYQYFSYFTTNAYVVGIHKKCLSKYPQIFSQRNKKNVNPIPPFIWSYLTSTILWADSADDRLMIFFSFFFPENRFDISCRNVSNLHKMSKAVLLGKKIRKIFKNVVCWNFYPECLVFSSRSCNYIITSNSLPICFLQEDCLNKLSRDLRKFFKDWKIVCWNFNLLSKFSHWHCQSQGKRGQPGNICPISHREHMLWCSLEAPH